MAFNYNIQCQTMNTVSIYRILTTKKIVIKHSFHLPLALVFTSLCLPYKTPATVGQQYGLHFPLYLFSNWGMS